LVADENILHSVKVKTVKFNPKQLAALKARLPKLKLAMDEGIDTAGVETALEEALEEVQALGEATTTDDAEGDNGEVMGLLKQIMEKLGGNKAAEDEAAETAKAAEKAEAAKNAGAMDAKIKAAADGARISIETRFRAAEKVAPITGKLDAMAFDSADAIYARALEVGGMKPAEHKPEAYAGIVDVLLQKRSEPPTPHGAADAAGAADLLKQFPALTNIRHA
jgi:hypothetical protein